MVTAKKPSDEHGIKDNIENTQKEEMTKLVSEVRERLRNYMDTEKPKEFFRFIGERLKSKNMDEAKFADFMIKEAEKSLTGDLRKGFAAFVGIVGAGETSKKGEKPGGGLGSMIWDSMINNSLVEVAECIKEANSKKMTVFELSESMSDDELKKLMLSKMGIAKEWRKKVQEGEKDAELSHLSSEGTFRAEAKKHAEAGMKKDIDRQQEKMRGLFNYVKNTVSKSKAWDENPRDLFTALEKKLSRAGIDKKSFADFIMHEVEMPLRLSFRQAMRAWKTEGVPEVEKIGNKEIRAKTINAISDEDVGVELVVIAKCLNDIAKRNTNLGQFFWEISEKDLMERSRNFAKGYINMLEIAELDKLKHPERGREYR